MLIQQRDFVRSAETTISSECMPWVPPVRLRLLQRMLSNTLQRATASYNPKGFSKDAPKYVGVRGQSIVYVARVLLSRRFGNRLKSCHAVPNSRVLYRDSLMKRSSAGGDTCAMIDMLFATTTYGAYCPQNQCWRRIFSNEKPACDARWLTPSLRLMYLLSVPPGNRSYQGGETRGRRHCEVQGTYDCNSDIQRQGTAETTPSRRCGTSKYRWSAR